MSRREVLMLVSALRGAPLTVLVTMLILGRPTGRNELAARTGYAENTVAKALHRLALAGVAQRHARYSGWVCTDGARRLPLALPPTDAAPDPEVHDVPLDRAGAAAPARAAAPLRRGSGRGPGREAQNVHLPSRSSSCCRTYRSRTCLSQTNQRLLLPEAVQAHGLHLRLAPGSSRWAEGGDVPVPRTPLLRRRQTPPSGSSLGADAAPTGKRLCAAAPLRQRWETPPSGSSLGADAAPTGERTRAAADPDLQAAVDLLVATGCPRRTSRGKGAVDAVQAALAGGWTSAKIREQVSGWLAYARCQETIHHAGFFTAARLRDCDPAPERPPKTADELAREHLARMYDRVVVR